MKKIFTILSGALLSASLWAQAPQKFSFQAVIRNASNSLIANKSVGMKISLLKGSEIGTAVYVETHTPTSNANGLVSIAIGGGTVVSGTFTSVDWANGPYFVKTEIDPTGGTSYSLTTTSQLLSVPYALHAKTAFNHYIGEQFGGGVIFHLWKDSQGVEHGLVVATNDQSSSQVWSNISNVEIGLTAQSSYDGLSNSNAILAQPGHTSSAAKLCLDLVSGGQSDWYLPSIQELKMLSNNYFTVVKSLSQISGASQLSDAYWSSSEYYNSGSWYFLFYSGLANDFDKTSTHYVRAVRAF